MGMWVFDHLLDDLADAFREDALWDDGEGGGGTIKGRFRIDAFEVPLGGIEPGLGSIQTHFYCDRRAVPGRLPELGDYLVIRGHTWEIVQRDEDDLGELGFRLIKETIGAPPFNPAPPSEPAAIDTEERRPGAPSHRDEIAAAYATAKLVGEIDDRPRSIGEVVRIVRRRLPCSGRGYGDKTLRRVLTPLLGQKVNIGRQF